MNKTIECSKVSPYAPIIAFYRFGMELMNQTTYVGINDIEQTKNQQNENPFMNPQEWANHVID